MQLPAGEVQIPPPEPQAGLHLDARGGQQGLQGAVGGRKRRDQPLYILHRVDGVACGILAARTHVAHRIGLEDFAFDQEPGELQQSERCRLNVEPVTPRPARCSEMVRRVNRERG